MHSMGQWRRHHSFDPRLTRRRSVFLILPILLIASACSTNVTESEEYLALQANLSDKTNELGTTQDNLTTAQSNLTEVESTLEETLQSLEGAEAAVAQNEARISMLEDSVAEADERAESAEAALDEELNRPWPDEVKEGFVVGCTDTPNEGLTDEEERDLCTCVVDELEEKVGLTDFLTFSILAFADLDAEINPRTGLPAGIDEDFARTLVDASTDCAFGF